MYKSETVLLNVEARDLLYNLLHQRRQLVMKTFHYHLDDMQSDIDKTTSQLEILINMRS